MESRVDPVLDLVVGHLSLARSLARRYAGRGEPLDDLVQVGAAALVAAARRYDAARGIPFAAYAAPTIEGELRRHLRDRSATIRVPRREQALAATIRGRSRRVAQELGREPSLVEAAAAAGVSVPEASAALGASAAPVTLLEVEERASPAAAEEFEACERRALLEGLLGVLTPREQEAVQLRYADDLSQQEIARRLGVSQSCASRVLASALEKLRRSAEPELAGA